MTPRSRWFGEAAVGGVRWLAHGILIVLFVILAPLSLALVWVRGEVLDTDRYVASVRGLAAEPAIQDAATARIMSFLDAAAAGEVGSLPRTVRVALAATYGPLRPTIEATVERVVGSAGFEVAWETINREAHAELRKLLRGEPGSLLTEQEDAVVVDLASVFALVQADLQANGITALNDVTVAPGQLTLTLFPTEDLEEIRRYVRLLNRLTVGLAIAAVAVALLAVVVAPNWRRGVFWLGVAMAIGAGLLWLLLIVGREIVVSGVGAEERAVPAAVYDTVLESFRVWTVVLAIVGLVVALGLVVARLVRRPEPGPA
jgi:hypothetical protein